MTDTSSKDSAKAPEPHAESAPGINISKLAIEIGPLAVFLAVSSKFDIFYGTGAFMAATLTALLVSRTVYGRIPIMPLISGVLVLVFGALTIYLQNDVFIKVKPTILYTLFGCVLLGGLMRGLSLVRYLFGEAYQLTEEGWRALTFRWGLFFLFLAVLNEVVWRNMSKEFWLQFKLFGFIPLTMAFAIAQMALIKKHSIDSKS